MKNDLPFLFHLESGIVCVFNLSDGLVNTGASTQATTVFLETLRLNLVLGVVVFLPALIEAANILSHTLKTGVKTDASSKGLSCNEGKKKTKQTS